MFYFQRKDQQFILIQMLTARNLPKYYHQQETEQLEQVSWGQWGSSKLWESIKLSKKQSEGQTGRGMAH